MKGKEEKINKSSPVYLFLLFSTIIIIVAIFIICCNTKNWSIVIFMPLSYLIALILAKNNKKYINNLSICIINICCFLKYVFYPLQMYIENRKPSQVVEATGFFIYDLLIIYICIELFSKKLLDNNQTKTKFKILFENESRFGIVNFVFAVIFIPLIIYSPPLLRKIGFVTDGGGSSSGIIAVLFEMSVWTILVSLLIVFSKMKDNKIISILLSLTLCVLYIFAIAIKNDNVGRWKILATGLAFFFVLKALYPENKKELKYFFAIGIVSALFLGTFVKFHFEGRYSLTNFYNNYISTSSLNDYFSGITNFNKGIEMINSNSYLRTMNSTLTDLFGQVPLLSKFFDAANKSSNVFFHIYTNRSDNICPLIIQSIEHFGKFFAPLLSFVFAFLSIYFNGLLKKSNNVFLSYVIVDITVYFSAFLCLNTEIMLPHLWKRLLFIALLIINYPITFKGKIINRKPAIN